MALQGFVKEEYLAAKLAALQAAESEWQGKTTAQLEAFLANLGMTPEQHYQMYGHTENLAPNNLFNAAEYKLAKATDMFNKGLEEGGTPYASIEAAQAAFEAAWPHDPYLHYLMYGSSEGINPSNSFDESSYLASKLAALQADSATAAEWAGKTADDLKTVLKDAGFSALGHYQAYGKTEGIAVTAVPDAEKVTTPDNSVPGETKSLTTDIDTITGTDNDDTYNGIYDIGDSIDGGKGDDTLRIVLDATSFDTTGTTISNVETLKLLNKVPTNDLDTINLNDQGYTTFNLDKTDSDSTDLALSGLGTSTNVEIGNLYDNKLTITYTDAAGDGDSATVTIGDAAAGAGIVAAGIETFNLVMTGSATVLDTDNALAAATTINITAGDSEDDAQEFSGFTTAADAVVNVSGKGDLDLGALAATIKTLNAANSSGDITATTNGAQTAVIPAVPEMTLSHWYPPLQSLPLLPVPVMTKLIFRPLMILPENLTEPMLLSMVVPVLRISLLLMQQI